MMVKSLLKTNRFETAKHRHRLRSRTAIGIVCLVLVCMMYSLILPVSAEEGDGGAASDEFAGKTFALVNAENGAAMLAEETTHNLNNSCITLKGKKVLRIDVDGDKTYAVMGSKDEISEIQTWTFEATGSKDSNGSPTYYLSSGEGSEKKYIEISSTADTKKNHSVTLAKSIQDASKITVTKNNEGKVRLSANNIDINLFGNDINRGFGGYPHNNSKDEPNVWFYLVSDIKEAKTIPGITPAGTVINMFDYWITDTDQPGFDNSDPDNLNQGINENHALKFRKKDTTTASNMNKWTGNIFGTNNAERPYQGIVKKVLENGYPVLTQTEVNTANAAMTPNTTYPSESLDYLFNPTTETNGKKTYRNVDELLQTDKEGYYYYDSMKNFAELNGDKVTLYNTWGVKSDGDSQIDGQFFPLNHFSEVSSALSTNAIINHYFGMTLTSRFVQQYGGHTKIDKKNNMIFEFAGDDDVWIFIDNVLVADLGGIHNKASVKIDFSTGEVNINNNEEFSTTIYDQYVDAEKENSVNWHTTEEGDKIFEDGSFHTLKFFYLERGNYDSNLHLKYNLNPYPETAISKVDQYGNGVENAKFAVYPADSDYNMLKKPSTSNEGDSDIIDLTNCTFNDDGDVLDSAGNTIAKSLYVGSTDSKGNMVFIDDNRKAYTIAELEDMFGSTFILKEIKAPDGYRQIGSQVNLKVIDHKLLVCENPADSGAQAAATLQIDAPGILKLVGNDKIINYYTPDEPDSTKGAVFAVVLRYVGKRDEEGNVTNLTDLSKQSNWAPVYSTQKDGFTVVDVKGDKPEDFISAAIETAKKYTESQQVFQLGSNGAMQGKLNGLPGDIRNYYYMLKGEEIQKTEYTIAYYYTMEDSLDEAKAKNTYRIDSGNGSDATAFSRVFGSTIQIPNLKNRMFVQKFDEGNNLVNGARFAIYEVTEDNDQIYYVTKDKDASENNIKILLENPGKVESSGDSSSEDKTDNTSDDTLQEDDNNNSDNASPENEDNIISGNASLSTGENGTYTIDKNTGIITATINSQTYTISPVEQNTTKYDSNAGEAGTVTFSNLKEGKYYVREIEAPAGYELNTSEIMVLVTKNSLYANAGTADDGVTVGRGPGYIVSTLNQYASQGNIDNTLSWIYSQLKISDPSTTFGTVTSTEYQKWRYITKNYAETMEDTTGGSDTDTDALTAYLKYDTGTEANTLFNYTLNTERIEEIKESDSEKTSANPSDTRRLYTKIGWSYLELFQDYDYGQVHKQTGANYEDWRTKSTNDSSNENSQDTRRDLSGFFSRSVYVQVTDQYDENVSLTINKIDDKDPDKYLKGAQFTLSRTAKEEGKDVTYFYSYDEENKSAKWIIVKDSEKKPTLTTNNNGQIVLTRGLLDGTYQLTEVTPPNGYEKLEKPIEFTVADGKIILESNDKVILTEPDAASADNGNQDADNNDQNTEDKNENNILEYTLTVKNTKEPDGPIIPTPETGNLKITKTVLGSKGDTNENFEFKITLKDKDGNDLTGSFIYGGSKSDRIKSGDSITLKHGEYVTIYSIPKDTNYKVEEVRANQDGYKTSSTGAEGTIETSITKAADFINTKGTVDADLTINGTKTMSGRNFKNGDTFKFTIARAPGEANAKAPLPSPATVTINPKVSDGNSIDFAFGKITYTEADFGKEYTYILTEEKGNAEDITYDTTPRYIVVKIEDGGEGKLKATATLNGKALDKITWNNISGDQSDVTLNTAKQITGRSFKDGDTFTFTITAPEGTPMPEKTKVTITPKAGDLASVDFGKIHFTEKDAGKTYTYTLTEEKGNLSGITYDTAEKTVTIKVEKGTDGKLSVKVNYGKDTDKILWKNTYQSGDLTVSKTVAGDDADKTKEFHFTVTLDQKLNGTYGDMTFKDGTASFTLKHGESKTAKELPAGIKYTVKEKEANQDGYTTSQTGDSGTIEANKTSQAAFTNTKEDADDPDDPSKPVDPDDPSKPVDPDDPSKPVDPGTDDPKDPTDPTDPSKPSKPGKPGKSDDPKAPGGSNKPVIKNESPQTGDSSKPGLWIALCAVSLAGMGFSIHIRPKYRRRRVRRK